MIIDAGQIALVLDTFTGEDFASAVASARRLAKMDEALISKSDSSVPTRDLRTTYARRARNPRLRLALVKQCEQLAQVAGGFPEERWHILIVRIDDQSAVTIFSNEDGVGRACLDYTVP